MYFHRQTDLVATLREFYSGEFGHGGNRCNLFDATDAVPKAALRPCIALALTYRLRKRPK